MADFTWAELDEATWADHPGLTWAGGLGEPALGEPASVLIGIGVSTNAQTVALRSRDIVMAARDRDQQLTGDTERLDLIGGP